MIPRFRYGAFEPPFVQFSAKNLCCGVVDSEVQFRRLLNEKFFYIVVFEARGDPPGTSLGLRATVHIDKCAELIASDGPYDQERAQLRSRKL
jgi:hypothetical protein